MNNRSSRVKAALLATTPLFIMANIANVQAQQISIEDAGAVVTNDEVIMGNPAVDITAHNVDFTNNGTLITDLIGEEFGFGEVFVSDDVIGLRVTNAGEIIGRGTSVSGIAIDNEPDFDTFDEQAIEATRVNVEALLAGDALPSTTVVNTGSVEATRVGIGVNDAFAGFVEVRNEGTVTVGTDTNESIKAIEVAGAGTSLLVENTGTVQSDGAFSTGVDAGFDLNYPEDLIELAQDGTFEEEGLSVQALVDLGLFDDKTAEVINRSGATITAGQSGIVFDFDNQIEDLEEDAREVLAGILGDERINVSIRVVNEEGASIVTNAGQNSDHGAGIVFSGSSVDTNEFTTVTAEVVNAGSINTSGVRGHGIRISGVTAANGLSVENSGTLETSGDFAQGVLVEGADEIDFVNSGSITTGGIFAHGIVFGSASQNLANDVTNSQFINDGTITVTEEGSIGIVQVYGSGNSIVNNGAIAAEGISGIGVIVFGGADDSIVENREGAVISANSPDGVGVDFRTLAGRNNTLANAGTISGVGSAVFGSGGNEFISNSGTLDGSVRLNSGNDEISNVGTIEGDVDLGAGDDIFEFIAGGTVNGIVDGSDGVDTLTLTRNDDAGDVVLDGSNFINFEELNQNSGGQIDLVFSGAVTFDTIGVSNNAELNLDEGDFTDTRLNVGDNGNLNLGEGVVASSTMDGGAAVTVQGEGGSLNSQAMVTTTGVGATAVSVTGANSSVDNAGGIMTMGEGSVGIAVMTEGASVTNNGTVTTVADNSIGVMAVTDNASVTNAEGRTISTQGANSTAIMAMSSSSSLANDGTVVTEGDNSSGLVVVGDDNIITNTSDQTIRTSGVGSDGIVIEGTGNEAMNTGTIAVTGADSVGVRFVTVAGDVNSFDNAGTISSEGDAILGGDGDETIINSGTINGNVSLGLGNDTFSNSSAVDGDILLGGGNDTLNWTFGASATGTVDGGDGLDIFGFVAGADEETIDIDLSSDIPDFAGFEAVGLNSDATFSFGEAFDLAGAGLLGVVIGADVTASADGGALSGGRLLLGEGSTLDLGADFSADLTSNINALIGLGDGATLNTAGSLTTMGEDNDVIFAGFVDGVTVNNTGVLTAGGLRSDGVSIGFSDTFTLDNAGMITTTGDEGIGINILQSANTTITNSGTISTQGASARGVGLGGGEGNTLTNAMTGVIATAGNGASGVSITDAVDTSLINDGEISTQGMNAEAVIVTRGEGISVENAESGIISTVAGSTAAIRVGGGTIGALIANAGQVETSGGGSHGVSFNGFEMASVSNTGTIATTGDSSFGVRIASGTGLTFTNEEGSVISTAGNTARGIDVNTVTTGSVVNAGSIETAGPSGAGIAVWANTDVSVTNSGTIATEGNNAQGIWAWALDGETITNSGAITTNGVQARGLHLGRVSGMDNVTPVLVNNSEITNSGTITTTGEQGHGVFLQFGSDNVIANTGTIDVSGNFTAGIWVGGTDNVVVNAAGASITATGEVDGVGVEFADEGSAINGFGNEGTLSGSTAAILGGSGAEHIFNAGTIMGNINLGGGDDSLALVTGESHDGMLNGGDGEDVISLLASEGAESEGPTGFDLTQIANFETLSITTASDVMFTDGDVSLNRINVLQDVEATLAGGTFMDVNLIAESGSTVSLGAAFNASNMVDGESLVLLTDGSQLVNHGSLTSSGTVISGDAGANTIVNAGGIDGNVMLAGGNDTYVSVAGSTLAGTVDGGEGDDTLDLRFNEDAVFDAAILDPFANFERFAKSGAGVLSFEGDAAFGDIDVTDGLLAVNAALTSNLTVAETAILGGAGQVVGNVVISGTLSPGNSIDTLTIDGNLVLDMTSIFEVEFNASGADQVLVSGSADLQGGTLSIVPDGDDVFGVFTYEVLRADGGITGDFGTQVAPNFVVAERRFEGNSLFLDIITQIGAGVDLDPQSEAVADYLNAQLIAGVAPATLDVFADLANLDPTTQLNGALAQLHGEAYAGAASISTTTALSVIDALDVHGLGARSVEAGQYGLWATGLTEFGDQDGQNGTSGFDTEAYGAMVGFGYGVADGVSVGALVGYQSVDQDFDTLASDTEADNVFFGAYSAAKFGGLNVDASFVYHMSDTETTRIISALDLDARADYDVDTIALRGRLGYDIALGDTAVLEPFAGLAYISSDRDDIVEERAEGARLAVDGGTTDLTFLDLGGRFSSRLGDATRVHVNGAWRYDLSDDPNEVSARFIEEDARFTVPGATLNDSRIVAGIGLNHAFTERLSAYVDYDGEFASDLNSHALRAGIRLGF